MNRNSYQKAAAAVMTAVMAGSLLVGCNQEPEETRIAPVVTTTAPTTVPTTQPAETTIPMETEPPVEAPEAGSISYEAYLELEVEVQEAYYESFESADAFFAWLDEAQAAYEATKPTSSGMEEGVEDWE